jgi:hypothetical protein
MKIDANKKSPAKKKITIKLPAKKKAAKASKTTAHEPRSLWNVGMNVEDLSIDMRGVIGTLDLMSDVTPWTFQADVISLMVRELERIEKNLIKSVEDIMEHNSRLLNK